MSRRVRQAVPYATAWLAASVSLARLRWASGPNPAGGLAYGWIGMLGALTAAGVRSWLRYRTALALLRELEPVRREN